MEPFLLGSLYIFVQLLCLHVTQQVLFSVVVIENKASLLNNQEQAVALQQNGIGTK